MPAKLASFFRFPHPIMGDTAQQANNEALENLLNSRMAVYDKLPPNPIDGQEIYFQNAAMAATGVVWRLRYRATAAGGYKWEFVGGSELHAIETLAQTVVLAKTDFTWQALAKSPSVTLPLSGEYVITMVAEYIQRITAGLAQLDLGVGVAPASPVTNAAAFVATTQWDSSSQTVKWAPGPIGAGQVMKILANGNIAEGFTVGSTYIGVLPVRVG